MTKTESSSETTQEEVRQPGCISDLEKIILNMQGYIGAKYENKALVAFSIHRNAYVTYNETSRKWELL